MKKWLVGLLVLLAVLVLVSPGIVGLFAERSLQKAVDQAEQESSEIVVTTVQFDRDWFTSAGRHRIEFRGGELHAAASDIAKIAGHDSVPALIINTELEHGIWPLTSTTDDNASFMPVLARSVSTMQLEADDGAVIDLPGVLHTELGLTGAARTRYLLDPGTLDAEDVRGEWGGADLLYSMAASGSSATVSGSIEPWKFETDTSAIHSGMVIIDAESSATPYGFNVGSLRLSADGLSITDAGETVSLRSLNLNGDSEIDTGRLSGSGKFGLGGVSLPGFGEASIDFQLTTNGVDARSLQNIFAVIEAAQSSSDPNRRAQDIDDLIESDVRSMLSKGASVHVEKLVLALPQGELNATFSFDMPQSDRVIVKSWASLGLLMNASVNISVDEDLLRFAQSMMPELSSLIALGYLRRDGSVYRLLGKIENGVVTINGAPMSIPMARL